MRDAQKKYRKICCAVIDVIEPTTPYVANRTVLQLMLSKIAFHFLATLMVVLLCCQWLHERMTVGVPTALLVWYCIYIVAAQTVDLLI